MYVVCNASYLLSVSRFLKTENKKSNCFFHYSMLLGVLELLIFYWRRPLDTEWEGEDHVKCINVLNSFKKSFFNRMRLPLRRKVGMLIRGIEKTGPHCLWLGSPSRWETEVRLWWLSGIYWLLSDQNSLEAVQYSEDPGVQEHSWENGKSPTSSMTKWLFIIKQCFLYQPVPKWLLATGLLLLTFTLLINQCNKSGLDNCISFFSFL